MRLGRWKLVKEYPGDWELYDMLEDRTETNDIASGHPALVGDLARRYDEWAERCGVVPRDKVLEMMRRLPGKAFWEEDLGWEIPERGRIRGQSGLIGPPRIGSDRGADEGEGS